MSNSGNCKETHDVLSSDASVVLKCWFYKQAPPKVLIELSPGVLLIYKNHSKENII